MKTVDEIKSIAKKYQREYEIVAIRTQDTPFELGSMKHSSLVWVDGEETEEGVNGVCATDIDSKYIAAHTDGGYRFMKYDGDHVAIIAGNSYSIGNDGGEVVIHDAVVVEIIG